MAGSSEQGKEPQSSTKSFSICVFTASQLNTLQMWQHFDDAVPGERMSTWRKCDDVMGNRRQATFTHTEEKFWRKHI